MDNFERRMMGHGRVGFVEEYLVDRKVCEIRPWQRGPVNMNLAHVATPPIELQTIG